MSSGLPNTAGPNFSCREAAYLYLLGSSASLCWREDSEAVPLLKERFHMCKRVAESETDFDMCDLTTYTVALHESFAPPLCVVSRLLGRTEPRVFGTGE